jgi:hypothetical protein
MVLQTNNHKMRKIFFLAIPLACSLMSNAQAPELSSWIQNTSGLTGSHYELGTFTPFIDDDLANVQLVEYSDQNVYIHCTGVPAYPTGPFLDGNPAKTAAMEYLFRIPRMPEQNTGTLLEPGLGHIGVWINGVPMYNYADAMSYNGMDIWHRNAVVFENSGFDCSKGHPAPVMGGPGPEVDGKYHHHQNPSVFSNADMPLSDVCDSYPADGLYTPVESIHSPLLGYAFDGYPVYGAYAYSNTDGSGGIRRMESGWAARSITDRTTLPDGTTLSVDEYGPEVGDLYPIGSYKEDFEYTGAGDLDIHNGRFALTPEYPDGTYAYYTTMDEDGNSAFPYVVGETYYGIVAEDNFGMGPVLTSVVIDETTTVYSGADGIESNDVFLGLNAFPNPTSSYVDIQLNHVIQAEAKIDIFDMNGRLVSNSQIVAGSLTARLFVDDWPEGIYIMHLQSNAHQTTIKLLVQRSGSF